MNATVEFFFWLVMLLFYAIGIVALFTGLPLYILSSFGLYKIATKEGIPYPWFAFIPLLNFYILGKLGFKSHIVGVAIPSLVLLDMFFENFVYPFVDNVFQTTFFTKPFFLGGYIVLIFVSSVLIFRRYSRKWILMTVISFFTFGFMLPVFLFVIRKNDLVVSDSVQPPLL